MQVCGTHEIQQILSSQDGWRLCVSDDLRSDWKPTGRGTFIRRVAPSSPDISLKAAYPHVPGANQEDFARVQERFARTNRNEDERRLAAYTFHAETEAVTRLLIGAGQLASAEVLSYPQHNQALREGRLPISHLRKLASLEDKPGDAHSKQVQGMHIIEASKRPPEIAPGTHIPQAHMPPTLAEWQRRNREAEPLRRKTIEEVAQGLIRRGWYNPTEAHRLAEQQFGRLTYEQLAVVTNPQAHTLIHAGPGTGKTLTASATLLHQLATGKIEPADVMVSSPTHSGLGALQKAINASATGSQIGENQYRTFHSFALSFLTKKDESGQSALDQLVGHGWSLLGSGKRVLESSRTVDE